MGSPKSMGTDISTQLTKELTAAHAIEEQALLLLEKGRDIAGDSEIGAIYAAHLLQTKEHERFIAERLEARGAKPSKLKDTAMKAGALGLGGLIAHTPSTPSKLAAAAYAFEHLEIATYRFLRTLAQRDGDGETLAVVERILEQEEAAAELVAGTFDRVVQLDLGEPGTAPLIPVTPIGKPSEREPVPGVSHADTQRTHTIPPDRPVDDRHDISAPTEDFVPANERS